MASSSIGGLCTEIPSTKFPDPERLAHTKDQEKASISKLQLSRPKDSYKEEAKDSTKTKKFPFPNLERTLVRT